jgi:5S rRNA maturation endonuclease (ribonuclease M5)
MWIEGCKQFKDVIPILRQFVTDTTTLSEEWLQATEADRGSLIDFYNDLHTEKQLLPHHREYLISRNFYPEEIQFKYRIECIGPVGFWKLQIFIPIYMNRRMVSFTTRDITGLADSRYRNCPNEFSEIPTKACLYNIDRVKGGRCIVVEGPTDVWRIGDGAVATLGTKYSVSQMNLLAKMDSIFILFDNSDEAQTAADRMGQDLSALVNHVEVISIDKEDPAELSEQEILHLRNMVFKKTY